MLVFGDPNDGPEPSDSQEEIKAISLKFQRFNYIGNSIRLYNYARNDFAGINFMPPTGHI
jgi:hypothetical protein